jgi:hypothetical protein
MGMMDDAWRESVRSKKVDKDEKIFDDIYLAEVKGRTRTSDGDFTTVGNKDIDEIKEILKHLIEKLDKISGMR